MMSSRSHSASWDRLRCVRSLSLINTIVFFLGNPQFDVVFNWTLTLYDLLLLIVIGLLYFIFFTTSFPPDGIWQEKVSERA